ncbi:MAG TPA: PLP-dependent aminotransferase family protein [Jatrophihabitantaceae bacterium]|nr:PLP-dependent aminotransferase family protein [Jatrophihabitantaceae bacterium]
MAPVSRIGGRALAALLPDLNALPGPVYSALGDAITALVLDGRIATETRLPSERELADALRLSRATVTAAYDALRTGGYLTSRTGSGSFVTVPPGSRPRQSLARWSPTSAAPEDVIDLSCAALPAPPGVVAPAVERAAAKLAPYACGDGYDPAGLAVLRTAVAARYSARGVPTAPEQVLITSGALHGVDLLLRLLLGPGDRVLTELPTYPGALDAVRAAGARLVPVPMAAGGSGGWQVDQMQATLRQAAPRLACLTPDFHNPTGALVDEAARRAVLRTARQTGTTVIVDESFVGFGFGPDERPCAAIDPTVISIGSLSKPVWGGLRIGWVRASAEMISRLAALRASIDLGGPVLDQLVAAELFADLDAILAARLAQLRPQRDALLAALARELPQWRTTEPRGGLSLWVELDAPLSTPLTLMALPAGVVLVPGSRFGVDGTLERFLRLPFSQPVAQLDEAVRRLAGVWSQLDRSGGIGPRQLVVA